MSFKFDFFADEEEDSAEKVSEGVADVGETQECVQVFVNQEAVEKFKELPLNRFTFLPCRPCHAEKYQAEKAAKSANVSGSDEDGNDTEEDEGLVRYIVDDEEDLCGEAARSDLIPNVYEGGCKVWECSLDLCEYLAEEKICLRGKRVLEVGCGCGVPGVFAYVGGASCVLFQDYNEEVLEDCTIPNIIINARDESNMAAELNRDCQFWAGDWQSFTQQALEKGLSYDVIVTSETIYCTANYAKLHSCLQSLLAPDGTVYVAAKSYYFGVGGGTLQFSEFVAARDVFSIRNVRTIDAGVKREILEMRFKSR